jgi:hypothetical protein
MITANEIWRKTRKQPQLAQKLMPTITAIAKPVVFIAPLAPRIRLAVEITRICQNMIT